LCYNLPYYAKKLEKYAPILPWLKFKHGDPWKTMQCDNIFGPPHSVLSPLSPIMVIHKKNGNLKICVDFRKLNKATKQNPYLLPQKMCLYGIVKTNFRVHSFQGRKNNKP
jgi:hypothetical protein